MRVYKILYVCLIIVWVMDILNFPFMAFMDADVPMNFLGWLLVWLSVPGTSTVVKHKWEKEDG